MSDKPKRRWYQFSLWTLFLIVTVICGGLGLLLGVIAPAERQRSSATHILNLGGQIMYAEDIEEDVPRTWVATTLHEWLPRDYLDHVIGVDLNTTEITDDDLRLLYAFPELQSVDLQNTQITDAGVWHLRELKKLIWLQLFSTQTTGEGTRRFQRELPECEIFYR